MGNANGREEGLLGGGGGDDVPGRSNGESGMLDHAQNSRVPSADLMSSSPLHSPHRSPSPLLFAPQVPVAPLLPQGGDAAPGFNQIWCSDPQTTADHSLEQGIPTLITWSYGGNSVAVEGSWDNWRSRKTLQRSGKDHTILLVLPSGVYRYKFIVDGEVRYIPDIPFVADEIGGVCNLLDVNGYVPDDLQSVSEFEAPLSPDSTYCQAFPGDEDFAKDPPVVPPQLHLTVLDSEKSDEADASSKPQHVVLNHVFIEKEWASQSVVALGLTQRFQSKYVTVVLYKPLKR
nr:SNF1-related protein kinase regulatory subunit beta-1 isoform X1 [Ipomoea trifida]GME03632.1 SNF1-related protein kinase regulatory subunit beta-1 [Ipomoea batatas]